MREFSNCLNALCTLVAFPLYLLVSLAALVGMLSILFSGGWLPAWLQFIRHKDFSGCGAGADGLVRQCDQFGSQRMGADMVWVDTLFGDGISGYLLMAGLVVAAIVLRQVAF